LKKQSKEINQINSLLDLDNWKLKNRVMEVLEERMHEKIMDFDEFKTLYPDELACLRFLEKLKEQNGFECIKCSNSRYSPGPLKFSRRCTRCGYNESITASTLFQGVRFPLTKAFYLAYLSHSHTGRKTYTLFELSRNLDLRLNTVWSFKQKVSRKIAIDEHHKKHGYVWEAIILDDRQKPNRSKSRSFQKVPGGN